jgi:U3 small nucleolar RNA-associated protein 22
MDQVAKHLAKFPKKVGHLTYQWQDAYAPYLQLVPPSSPNKKNKSPKYQVHLHFGMQNMDWIPKLRLVPNRCNLKELGSDLDGDGASSTEDLFLSHSYNQALLNDARHLWQDEHLESLAEYKNIESACLLIQVWALQRGLWRNHDGFTKESVALLLVYLFRTNKMNPRMTPLQIFTVVLQTLTSTNWLGDDNATNSKPDTIETVRAAHSQGPQTQQTSTVDKKRTVLVLPLEGCSEGQTIQQSQLDRLYQQQTKESPLTNRDPPTLLDTYASTYSYTLGPVFLDPTMTYNYWGGVSPNYMKLAQAQAKKSLAIIQSKSAFGHLFMKPARFWSQWDIYIEVPIAKTTRGGWESSTRQFVATLERALGNRIHGLRLLSTGNGDVTKGEENSDQIPSLVVTKNKTPERSLSQSPTGSNTIVLGISVSPETSQRIVDRGPPSDHTKEVQTFLELWGAKAQLRRFKDGAIVQAVVWNDDTQEDAESRFQNDNRVRGGIVERIVRHIVQLHYTKEPINFSLPSLVSLVDGILTNDKSLASSSDPWAAHRNVMKAFDSLSEFLRKKSQPSLPGSKEKSRLSLPLAIDSIEPLSPCLRYSELFPPVPLPFLGGPSISEKRVSGVVVSDPILIQLRFGASSKWPTDLKAMGAAKTAMLIQLANGLEKCGEDGFEGPITVTPSYAELGYKGYCFRILVRADPEIRMLQGLQKPSPAASALLKDLTRKHILASKHHSTIHAVHTLHPSAAVAVRMAKRWIAGHLLSGLLSDEMVELMVAKVYTDHEFPLDAPGTVVAGFLRFLHLLATHDWAR